MSPPDGPAFTQTDRVVLLLRERVLGGEFAPGDRLTELDLAARLGASRTPIRQALVRLAHEGLLDAQPSGGFRVRTFTLDDVWDAIEIRGVLEGTAARLAAERLTSPADLEGLRRSLRAMDALQPIGRANFPAYLAESDRFHHEVWRLSKSPLLISTIESVLGLPFASPGALVFSDAESADAARVGAVAAAQHHEMVGAIAARAGTRAEHLAREHAVIARRNLERALGDRALFARVPGAALIRRPVAG
jgi:GntR family transcriptional regulator of vanillate catabolism